MCCTLVVDLLNVLQRYLPPLCLRKCVYNNPLPPAPIANQVSLLLHLGCLTRHTDGDADAYVLAVPGAGPVIKVGGCGGNLIVGCGCCGRGRWSNWVGAVMGTLVVGCWRCCGRGRWSMWVKGRGQAQEQGLRCEARSRTRRGRELIVFRGVRGARGGRVGGARRGADYG